MKKFFLVVFFVIGFVVFTQWSHFFRIVIPSTSMSPTLCVGDQLLAYKIKGNDVKRGDVIVFNKDGTLYIKRVIGLPGDIVNIESGSVFINGCLLKEDYVGVNDDFTGLFYVPDNHVFVLGDNRSVSFDARYWDFPFIPTSSILGKAVLFLYPELHPVVEVFYEVF